MDGLFESFFRLFIILNPFVGMAAFVHLTTGMNLKQKLKQANIAVGVALLLLLFFLFTGNYLFSFLGISLASFKIGGGLVLLLLGVQGALGLDFKKTGNTKKAAAVIIGTPLLCGPGAITSIITLQQSHGYMIPLVAVLIVSVITWVMLACSHWIAEKLGHQVIEVFSRIMGLMLCAMAIEFIKNGIVDLIKAH